MTRYFTDFGMIEADSQESANSLAYVRWLEEGWAQGGYKPMTREQFEIAHPEVMIKYQKTNGARGS